MIMTNQQQQQQTHMQNMQQIQDHNNTHTICPRQITQVDVLCGRGKMSFHHEGNNRYRMLIAEHADTYKMAPTKKMKMEVVLLIVEIIIARGGRFLVSNTDGTWSDGGRQQGKKKTGHAFRDALRGRVKCITLMRAQSAQNTAMMKADDVLSYASLSTNSDEYDWDHNDGDFCSPTPLGATTPDLNIEPSKEWRRNSIVNVETANDLIKFFLMSEEL